MKEKYFTNKMAIIYIVMYFMGAGFIALSAILFTDEKGISSFGIFLISISTLVCIAGGIGIATYLILKAKAYFDTLEGKNKNS